MFVDWEKVRDQAARNKVSQLLRAEARNRRRGGGIGNDDNEEQQHVVNRYEYTVPPGASIDVKRRKLQDDFANKVER
jgi:hypothetical protein